MDVISIAILLVLLCIAFYGITSKNGGNPNLPSVHGWPLVGVFPFLGKSPRRYLTKLAQQYGQILKVKIGLRYMVQISSYELVDELMKQGPLAGRIRSQTTTNREMSGFHHDKDVKKSMKKRAMLHQAIKTVQRSVLYSLVKQEAGNLADRLLKNAKSQKNGEFFVVSNIEEELDFSFVRLMYRLTFNKNEAMDAATTSQLRGIAHGIPVYSEKISAICSINVFPFLKYWPASGFGDFRSYIKLERSVCSMGISMCATTSGTDEQEPAHRVGPFMAHFMAPEPGYDDISGIHELTADFLRGGTETSTHTLSWMIVYMISYPDIQSRMARDLRNYQSTHGPFDADVHIPDSLPYIHGFITETLRHGCVNPFCERVLEKDVVFSNGLTVSSGSDILINVFAMTRDPDEWPEPEVFQPERFLRPDGSFDSEKASKMHVFGFGRRNCPGEALAWKFLSVFLVTMVIEYEMKAVTDEELDLVPLCGISLRPKPYRLMMRQRNPTSGLKHE